MINLASLGGTTHCLKFKDRNFTLSIYDLYKTYFTASVHEKSCYQSQYYMKLDKVLHRTDAILLII